MTRERRIDELIGMQNIKEQVAVWRTEKQIEQLLADQGEAVSASDGDHMIFEGPPGTAKTTIARIVAEVLFGLGKLETPEVKEVSEADIVVGYISQTAARMREVCEQALGGVDRPEHVDAKGDAGCGAVHGLLRHGASPRSWRASFSAFSA